MLYNQNWWTIPLSMFNAPRSISISPLWLVKLLILQYWGSWAKMGKWGGALKWLVCGDVTSPCEQTRRVHSRTCIDRWNQETGWAKIVMFFCCTAMDYHLHQTCVNGSGFSINKLLLFDVLISEFIKIV